jgi:type II secretory pathway pseudopilin PulG
MTLVEIMLVIAIIAILVAISVPMYTRMQMEARRSELPACLHAVAMFEITYENTFDTYIATDPQPRADSALDKHLVPWVTDAEWSQLGWGADGYLRGNYYVDAPSATEFTAYAHADVDDDGTLVEYTASMDTMPHIDPSLVDVF